MHIQNLTQAIKAAHFIKRIHSRSRSLQAIVIVAAVGLCALGGSYLAIHQPPQSVALTPVAAHKHKASTTTTTTSSPTPPSTTTSTSPATAPATTTAAFYVDPNNDASRYAAANPSAYGANQIAREGQQPVAKWFGSWNSAIQADVSTYVNAAAAAHAVPVLVAYNIPYRDCGGYSSGGALSESDYATWIQQFAAGIGGNTAIVILEPDAVAQTSCLSTDQLAARWRELSGAVNVLRSHAQTSVYLDAGNPTWLGTADAATRLQSAGIANASGFALNVSNFFTTASNVTYGTQVSALVGGKHFVIDTSRNGNGPTADNQWCNPAGRALGTVPTTSTGNALADAFLWIKTPWQSDGSCNGGPAAGQDNWQYAADLAKAAGW
jgi:endoglucanase